MSFVTKLSAAIGAAVLTGSVSAGTVGLGGGQTNVLLDTDLLSDAAGLTLSGVSDDVIVPGDLGASSVAFAINDSTTFTYDPDDFLGTFGGTIEHDGSVFFDSALGEVEVGDFRIGFDATRAGGLGGLASGFFVESTTGIAAILFDIENPSSLEATDTNLNIGANLLVSGEFGQFLLDNGLSQTNLAGADVGDALVAGIVPAPAAGLVLLAPFAVGRRRRNC